ncbi:MAG: PRC-barrel domain-containing protein [Bradymonadaceae bacterium]|nr:PRC-barrel domain-containing protein [Lujinxingiaceae bacterium]
MRTDSGEEYVNRLARLTDLDDYEVSDDDPDVRGWDVIDRQGIRLGRVDELIVDRDALKVRYLAVELDATGGSGFRLVPIGLAALDEDDDIVILNHMDAQSVTSCPTYDSRPISREYEQRLMSSYRASASKMGTKDATRTDPSGSPTAAPRGFYDDTHFDESSFYGGRRKTRGPMH